MGELTLAGVGIRGPIMTLISSFSALTGFGGALLLAIWMGERNAEAARRVVTNSFMMLMALAVCLTGTSLLLEDHLLMWSEASEVTSPYTNQYIAIYLYGTVFALTAVEMNQSIICQGFTKTGMKSVMFGVIVNLMLDPMFILGFCMGISGAALAAVLTQVCSAIYILLVLFGEKVPVKITSSGSDKRVCGRILALGFLLFIIITLDNVLIITMSTVLQTYGGPERGNMMVTCGTIM